jgi:predicted ATP-dependent endonuclease of OLD family
MDLASATLTKVILESWHEIFDEQLGEKKIELDWKPESDQGGGNEHTVYVKFQVRQGTDRFDISDRSLGFRWFFCFLLFTQFRSHRKGGQGTLFLFDEPASNLHAKAQERLLKCFADISKSPNALIYSTHSQHMINPAWIDFSYIVENKDIDYERSSDARHVTSNSTDISAVRYQQFVNSNPGKTSYYQPVLDRLEVKPSLMELKDGSALVEGKSDFYILRYMANALNRNVIVVPAFGSTTFDALIPLLMGLAKQFYIILDSDAAGSDAMKAYGKFEIGDESKIDLKSVTGFSEPEKFLSESDLLIIQTEMSLTKKPTKKQIMRFFREALATGKEFHWSKQFGAACEAVFDKISDKKTGG